MIFYLLILLVALFFSRTNKGSFLLHLIILAIISLKGNVGPDFGGYFNRYLYFDPLLSLTQSRGEIMWYFLEYCTYTFKWDYQIYTMFTGVVGVGFLYAAQKNINYLGFVFFIFQIVLIQLGLSGMRQFIATCILIYIVSDYLFNSKKSPWKFIFYILLASSFHISAMTMIFILPFLYKLHKWQILTLLLLGAIVLSSEIINSAVETYDIRYLQTSRDSFGAWFRFVVTVLIIFLGIKGASSKLRNLGYVILILGVILGIINSVGLHRYNYYFLPVVFLLLIKNYQLGNIKKWTMNKVYIITLFYFFSWWLFSTHAIHFIPYNFFFSNN